MDRTGEGLRWKVQEETREVTASCFCCMEAVGERSVSSVERIACRRRSCGAGSVGEAS